MTDEIINEISQGKLIPNIKSNESKIEITKFIPILESKSVTGDIVKGIKKGLKKELNK